MTFQDGDKFERKEILEILDSLIEMVAQRMKNRNLYGKIISVYLKNSDAKLHKRNSLQKTLFRPIGSYAEIKKEAIQLFDRQWHEQSIKFIGIRMTGLVDKYDISYQSSLFDKQEKKSLSMGVMEKVNAFLGKKVLMSGTELLKREHKAQNQSRYIETDRVISRFDVKKETE